MSGARHRLIGFMVLAGGLVFGQVLWAASSGEGGEAHHTNWGDLLIRTINFAILVGILYKLLKKPITNFFITRRQNIENLLKELEQKREEAERKCAEYKAKLAILDKEAESILQEYIAQAEKEKAKILEAAERQANYIRQQAKLAIQQEIKAAKDDLREEVAELTIKAAEDILRKKIGMEDQNRLVEEFIVKVVEAK